jgi:ABC-type uncharacterized transport system YnjBCD substrate-binding protein
MKEALLKAKLWATGAPGRYQLLQPPAGSGEAFFKSRVMDLIWAKGSTSSRTPT